ncbi:MAG TPA: hypothetical protein VKA49_01770 [Flavitalea sp.]|nr:hypothetical protein [Flavitalea sp.]
MLTKINLRFFGLLVAAFIASSSFAQTSAKDLQFVVTNNSYVKVYENVKTEFDRKFANAEGVVWDNLGNNFLAKFSIGDVKYRTLFNSKGRLIYKNTYGDEKLLPTYLRKDVKRNYIEYLITSVVLVEEANRSIWVINLEDDTNYVIARVENDEIEEVKQYMKRK